MPDKTHTELRCPHCRQLLAVTERGGYSVCHEYSPGALEVKCPRSRCGKKIYIKKLDLQKSEVYNTAHGEQEVCI